MRKKIYSLGLTATLALAGLAYFGIDNYYTPVYQSKAYSSLKHHAGLADYAAQWRSYLLSDYQTGEVDEKAYIKARNDVRKFKAEKNNASQVYWQYLGPNFVGGRTRCVLQDNQPGNESILYSGSVAGGFFMSWDYGTNWHNLSQGLTSLAVSCLAQDTTGVLFLGTGPEHDSPDNGNTGSGSFGDGLFRGTKNSEGTFDWERLIGPTSTAPSSYRLINQVATSPVEPGKLFIGMNAGSGGLKYSSNSLSSEPTFNDLTFQGLNLSVDDIAISNDGKRVYVATRGGNIHLFLDNGGDDVTYDGVIGQLGGNRAAIALAPSNDSIMYAAVASPCLHNIYQNRNIFDSEAWTVIGPSGGSFDPYANVGINCQGFYDNAIAVYPDNPGKIIVGGVQLWSWTENASNPGTGGWSQIAVTQGGGLLDINYVHADKHRILIPDPDNVIIASDGGIGKSIDGGTTWGQNNNGYSATQFYTVDAAYGLEIPGFGTIEQVVGGTQDNGTQLIGTNPERPEDAVEIKGGDGFSVAFSNLANQAFASVYGGDITRHSLENPQGTRFFNQELEDLCEGGCGPFFTRFGYWETAYAENTFDSVKVFADTVIAAGDSIDYVSSNAGETPMRWVPGKELTRGDSVMMPDFAQSKFLFATGPASGSNSINFGPANRLYLTRDAANLKTVDQEWYLLASPTQGTPNTIDGNIFGIKFSADGNQAYFGTSAGSIYRVDNLNQGYDYTTLDVRSALSVVTVTRIGGFSGTFTNVAVDPNNPDNLVATYGGSNGAIYYATNASTASSNGANFSTIKGDLPNLPIYSAVIADNDPNVVIIGTEFGIFQTDNVAGAATQWTAANAMPETPVYALVQQTVKNLYNSRYPEVGDNAHYRKIYAGTHGRGFWSTSDMVGIDETTPDEFDEADAQILFKIYPNPINAEGFMEIDMPENESVTIDIYDLNGRVIETVHNGLLNEGMNRLQFDVNNMNNGTYIATIRSGDEMKVSKFVVLK